MNTTTYPNVPGSKGEVETGRQSAKAVEGVAKLLRQQCEEAYRGAAMTHDECAELLRPAGMDAVTFETFKRSVRSRSSELKGQGKIVATDKRRCNVSGHKAVVWRSWSTPVQQELI